MKAFFKLFDTQIDRMINPQTYIDCRSSPSRLLSDLKQPAQLKKLIKAIQSPSTNPFKYIRVLSLCNLLLIYGRDYFTLIQEKLKMKITRDDWLNIKFIQPYHRFLIKCCTSKDQYNDVKNCYLRKGQALESLFYSINMIKLLFKIVEKMPFLGRYYKPSQNEVVSSTVQVIALQAQKLYGFFKATLSQILLRRQFYIKSKEDEKIMRGVLAEELIYINEEMKKLFLDKYFYPLGRGIGVKLFRPEQQTPQFQKVIHSIVSDHQNTERMKKHEQLQKTLFPGSGLVNWNFYQETLLALPLNQTGRLQDSTFKQLDDIILSEQEEEYNVSNNIQRFFIKQKNQMNNQSQKQTNSGTIQIKGKQL